MTITSRHQRPEKNEKYNWVVLVVDDVPDNLMVAKTVLTYSGAQVYTATNGAEALTVLKTITPTVILLDIRMPTMNGWEMYEALRKNPTTQHIPVIALTAQAMEKDRQEILEAGFDGYIAKPFDILSLISNIRDVLSRVDAKR